MAIRHDLTYAARSLRKTPGLVVVVVLTLALGIGVNATMFNLLNVLLLAPPTAVSPDRLVRIEPGNGNLISYANYRDLASGFGSDNRVFDGMALASGTSLNWRNGDLVEQLPSMMLSANFFAVMGTPAWLGRAFTEAESPERNPAVVVLSYEFWQRRFANDREVIGRTLNLNAQPFTVIGVMPRGYRVVLGQMSPQMFVPIGPAVVSGWDNRRHEAFSVVARLAPGVGFSQAQAAFAAASQSLELAFPKENISFGRPAFVAPVSGFGSLRQRNSSPEVYIGLAAPFVVGGMLLLIACANVAGVMLARGSTRQREIAIRLALGAGRARVIRMLLADCLVLALLGAAGGLLLTAWITPLVSRIQLPNTPALPPFTMQMDPRLALYMLAVVVVTCVFCGLIPARQTTRPQILPQLKQRGNDGAGGGMRRLLVGAQVAASALLLVTCLLFLRSLIYVNGVNPGFDIDRGVTARITPEQKNFTAEQTYALAEELARRASGLPGVESATFASLIPLGGDSVGAWAATKENPDTRGPAVLLANVGPAYFGTMGIRMLRGREFHSSDRKGAPEVAVVNETFARIYFPTGDALGKTVRVGGPDTEPWREIVGIAADNKYEFYAETPTPQLFAPFLQTGGRIFLQVRTAAPSTGVAAVRRMIADLDRFLLADVRTTRDATSLEFSLRRYSTSLLATLGILGLVLSMIGLYGVLAWEVSRRTAEIGIRMALGATHANVRGLVLRNALLPVGAGVVLGVAAAMALGMLMRSFLAGVGGADPLTIGGVAALLLVVSLAASWIPARRATRVDPMVALRWD